MRQFFYLAMLACLCTSCNTETSSKSDGFGTMGADTIELMPYNEIDLSRMRATKFNLPEIIKGVDSFELRIWFNSMMIPDFSTILRYSDTQWVAHEYEYYENGNSVDSVVIRKINLTDSIGKVVSYLSDSSVLNLPSQYAIPGFIDNIADGQTIAIETSTKTFYKALHYHCPEHFTDKYNKRFMGIINYLNSYLNFNIPKCLPAK